MKCHLIDGTIRHFVLLGTKKWVKVSKHYFQSPHLSYHTQDSEDIEVSSSDEDEDHLNSEEVGTLNTSLSRKATIY